jgi:hypothetical protein
MKLLPRKKEKQMISKESCNKMNQLLKERFGMNEHGNCQATQQERFNYLIALVKKDTNTFWKKLRSRFN